MADVFGKKFRKIDELVRSVEISIDQQKLNETRAWLIQFYKDYLYEGDIEERVDNILVRAMKGWRNASEDFDVRIKALIGHRTLAVAESRKLQVEELRRQGMEDEEIRAYFRNPTRNKKFKKLRKEEQKIRENLMDAEQRSIMSKNDILPYLNTDEQEFWRQREIDYRKEFDFNDSSDKVLLDEVIYNEVLLRRIKIVNLTGNNKESIKGLREPDLLQNHQRLLEKLGVLRVQRIELNQDVEGNVSELTLLLENKLKEIGKIEDKKTLRKALDKINFDYKYLTFEELAELLEEAVLLREVEKMGDLNPIPQAVFAQVESELEKKQIKISDFDQTAINFGDVDGN